MVTGGAAAVGGELVGSNFNVNFSLNLGICVDGAKGEPGIAILILTQFLSFQRHFSQRFRLLQTSIVDVVIEAPEGPRNLALELFRVDWEICLFDRVRAEDLFLIETDDAERVARFRLVVPVAFHGAP